MPQVSTNSMNIWGQLLWLAGCGTFFTSAWRGDDPWVAVGSLLFAIGILFFLVPLIRNRQVPPKG